MTGIFLIVFRMGGGLVLDRKSLEVELDALEQQYTAKQTKLDASKAELRELQDQITEKNRRLKEAIWLEDQRHKFQNITISDHAIVRWLERRHNVDMDEIKKEILTPQIESQAKQLLNGTYMRRVIKNGVVVTVLD